MTISSLLAFGHEGGLADPLAFRRGPAWRNRIALAPLTNLQSDKDGKIGEEELRFLTMRAKGGFGLVMTCAAAVQQSGVSFSGQLSISSDAHIEGLSRLATALRACGAASAVQLQHAGARAVPAISKRPALSPYADARRNVRALTSAEVEELIGDYVAAAVRAQMAGIDGIELHGAHGYMLCQFLHAERNTRTDGFGGSYEGRTRIFRDIIDGIRKSTTGDFQLGVRLSPENYGYPIEEALRLAGELLVDDRVDYVDMSLWDCFKVPGGSYGNQRRLVDFFGALDRRPGTRLGVAGRIRSGGDALDCIASGADFVFMGRGAIVQHDLARHSIEYPDKSSAAFPVARAQLAQQGVGPAFQDYLIEGWPDDFVE